MQPAMDHIIDLVARRIARDILRRERARREGIRLVQAVVRRYRQKAAPPKSTPKRKARPVYLKVKSCNTKLAKVVVRPRKGGGKSLVTVGPAVDAVYLPVSKTCPASCPAKLNGCFAQDQMVTRKVEQDTAKMTADAIVDGVVAEIAHAKPPQGRWLRWAASGDVRHAKDASRVAEAVAGSYGPRAWGYTHRWQSVPRVAWGSMSILASVDRPEDASEAAAQGYAPAIVAEHPSGPKAFRLAGSKDWRWVPCLQESVGRTCVECRLCFRADLLRDHKIGIAFQPHGQRKQLLVDALGELRQPQLVPLKIAA